MKIERIDDKTVKCFLSNEELEAYEIDYKDFINRSDKAREVVQEIIVQAEEEVGYKPPQFAFDLQIMMVPDQGLLLTFSEKDPEEFKDSRQLIQCLQEMKNMLQQAKDKISTDSNKATGSAEKERKEQTADEPDYAIFGFARLADVMGLAAVLPRQIRVFSSLYKLGDIYYLLLQKGSASYDRYSRTCVQALEFGWLYAANDDRRLMVEEHGECLIAQKALQMLRK